ncbi:OLC1v1024400C2 [Oldenlandia corymbosa var. corymbosa]|nr:OLC1v1024400C2 [Oldenlandia corymbosa var. corymbosa]
MQKAVEGLTRDLNAESLRRRGTKRDVKMEKIESGLARARALIQKTLSGEYHQESSLKDSNYIPHGEIYINPRIFYRSYFLMERLFKIFIYEEGEPPLFHNGPFNDIYSLEGILLSSMEKSVQFRTDNPDEAHVYLLPFSVVMIIQYLFDPIIRDKAVLERVIGDYVRIISTKYPYWNRSLGSDHLMVSCHDWGPRATWYVRKLYFTSMRALCNANTSEFFNPRKDVSFPEINLQTGNISGLTGGFPPENRTVLAFFAGGLHGRIRPSLFQHWMNKDDDIKVYENLPNEISYHEMMQKSKYCLCPSGHEVASPRIVEAIYAECVPVLISQHYVLPFSDVLDWSSFSIEISVGELPNLKSILMGISEDRYRRMQERVKQVQRHFLINDPPKPYDVFHMVIHSIWLRRLNVRIYG